MYLYIIYFLNTLNCTKNKLFQTYYFPMIKGSLIPTNSYHFSTGK